MGIGLEAVFRVEPDCRVQAGAYSRREDPIGSQSDAQVGMAVAMLDGDG